MALTAEGIIDVPGMMSRWVRLSNGEKAHYMTSGESGPAVMLLHGGIPGSSGTAGWRFMAPYLASKGFTVYAPDMPGYGLSDNRPQYWPKSLADHTDFVQRFVDAVCLDKFHLAGNSMGCGNTVNYVVAHPERVLSFMLIAGPIGDIVPRDIELPRGPVSLDYRGTRESMQAMMEAIIYRTEAISSDLLDMRQSAAERHAAGMKAFFPRMGMFTGRVPWDDKDIEARLSTKGRLDKITIPGIYLYGKDDVLSPVEIGYIQEEYIPNIQMFYPEECGHQGQTDQPEMFNKVAEEFFSTGKVSRKTADWAGVSTRRPELAHLVEQA